MPTTPGGVAGFLFAGDDVCTGSSMVDMVALGNELL